MPQCRLDILRARQTDYIVNCKAGWASPDSIKKHMFFKKGSWTVRTSIQQQYHFPICKDGEENGLHVCLAILYFHPYIWVYTVGYATYIFWCFFVCGIGIRHDNDPLVSNQFQWAICGGARSAFSPYTIQENRHGESLELNFSGEAVTEDVQHWTGWLEDFP